MADNEPVNWAGVERFLVNTGLRPLFVNPGIHRAIQLGLAEPDGLGGVRPKVNAHGYIQIHGRIRDHEVAIDQPWADPLGPRQYSLTIRVASDRRHEILIYKMRYSEFDLERDRDLRRVMEYLNDWDPTVIIDLRFNQRYLVSVENRFDPQWAENNIEQRYYALGERYNAFRGRWEPPAPYYELPSPEKSFTVDALAKSDELLRKSLSDNQLSMLDAVKGFAVVGSLGGIYWVRNAYELRPLELRVTETTVTPIACHCVYIGGHDSVPPSDYMYAQKIAIEVDEAAWRKTAYAFTLDKPEYFNTRDIQRLIRASVLEQNDAYGWNDSNRPAPYVSSAVTNDPFPYARLINIPRDRYGVLGPNVAGAPHEADLPLPLVREMNVRLVGNLDQAAAALFNLGQVGKGAVQAITDFASALAAAAKRVVFWPVTRFVSPFFEIQYPMPIIGKPPKIQETVRGP